MYSVLQNKNNIKFNHDPYPYFVIDDALPNDLYNSLNDSFPEYEEIIKSNRGLNTYEENTAYRLNAFESLQKDNISEEWKNLFNIIQVLNLRTNFLIFLKNL